jgi:hypothetical protein
LLADWQVELEQHRRRLGSSVSIGATPFILDVVPKTWNQMVQTLNKRGVDLSLQHVHTGAVRKALENKSLDLVLGGVLLDRDTNTVASDNYDFLGWNREPFVVVSNYPRSMLPGPTVTPDELQKLTLLRPGVGIIDDFMVAWYGKGYERKLNVFDVTGDILFKLSLLRSESIRGWIPVPEYLVKSENKSSPNHGLGLHKFALYAPDLRDLDVVAGVFMRKHDREMLSEDHPLNVIWAMFEDVAKSLMPAKPRRRVQRRR